MKSSLVIVFLASSMLLSILPALAASVNLICTEKGGTEKAIDRNGESEKPVSDFWSIPVSVDTDSNRATLWGASRDLSIKPDKLHIQEFTTERTPHRDSTKIQVLIIDRKTLSFTYTRNSSLSSYLPSLRLLTTNSTTKKSYGSCVKIKEVKGSKV